MHSVGNQLRSCISNLWYNDNNNDNDKNDDSASIPRRNTAYISMTFKGEEILLMITLVMGGLTFITVLVWSGVSRQNQDSLGSCGFYRYDKTGLLA